MVALDRAAGQTHGYLRRPLRGTPIRKIRKWVTDRFEESCLSGLGREHLFAGWVHGHSRRLEAEGQLAAVLLPDTRTTGQRPDWPRSGLMLAATGNWSAKTVVEHFSDDRLV